MARVLTPEEIMALPDRQDNIIPVVIEKKAPFQKWDGGSHCSWAGSDFAKEQYEDTLFEHQYEWYTYGKTMRIWDGLPTFEEREATPWRTASSGDGAPERRSGTNTYGMAAIGSRTRTARAAR